MWCWTWWVKVVGGDGRRQRQIRERRVLNRDEVYDGALEDILCGNLLLLCFAMFLFDVDCWVSFTKALWVVCQMSSVLSHWVSFTKALWVVCQMSSVLSHWVSFTKALCVVCQMSSVLLPLAHANQLPLPRLQSAAGHKSDSCKWRCSKCPDLYLYLYHAICQFSQTCSMLPPGQTWHSVIWCLVFGISWTEHRSNQEVLDMVDENRSLNTIRQRQKNWLGHVLRSESHLCTVGIHFSTQERTRTRETECYDDRLDEEQRCGI